MPAPLPDAGPRKPVLISFNDDTKHRLSHLKTLYGFDPLKAEFEVLGYSHLAQSLSQCRKPLDPKISAERAARFHKLLSHCSRQAHISAAGTLTSRVFATLACKFFADIFQQIARLIVRIKACVFTFFKFFSELLLVILKL